MGHIIIHILPCGHWEGEVEGGGAGTGITACDFEALYISKIVWSVKALDPSMSLVELLVIKF